VVGRTDSTPVASTDLHPAPLPAVACVKAPKLNASIVAVVVGPVAETIDARKTMPAVKSATSVAKFSSASHMTASKAAHMTAAAHVTPAATVAPAATPRLGISC
jgi:hypothetical protein